MKKTTPQSHNQDTFSRRQFIGNAAMTTAATAAFAPVMLSAAESQAPSTAASAPRPQPANIVSLEIHPDKRVTFRLFAPNAGTVKIGGDYPIGNTLYRTEDRTVVETELTKDKEGIWSVTVGPLSTGFYGYYYMVDGKRTLDFNNTFVNRDSINYLNVLRVPGPELADYEINNVPHGTLSKIWYSSPSLAVSRQTYVYTPPGYETSTSRFPVLYLMHGGSGDEDAWTTLGNVPQILDNLIAQKKIKPMIVVMPNCNETLAAAYNVMLSASYPKSNKSVKVVDLSKFPQSVVEDRDITNFPKSMVTDLIPFIDKTYRTRSDKNSRAVAGLSVGAAQTLFAAFNYPEMFAYVGAFSGGYNSLPGMAFIVGPPPNADKLRATNFRRSINTEKYLAMHPRLNADINSQFKLLCIAIGLEDGLITSHSALKGLLDRQGVKYTVMEKEGYSHEWSFWRVTLHDILPKLFS